MPFDQHDCRQTITNWIDEFNKHITSPLDHQNDGKNLFLVDSFWRDALGLTWQLDTYVGNKDILNTIRRNALMIGLSDVQLDCEASPPQCVNRAGTDAIEAFIKFETKDANGRGIIRLCEATKKVDKDTNGPHWRAWTFFTAIDSLKDHQEQIDRNRPTGSSYSRDFRGPNWLDERIAAQQYDNRDPAVLVVGGGQAGLSIAARLTQLGIDTLIVDKNSRIGDNWRNRYHALTLHNQLHVNHLPYVPFPPTWPTYIPKDMLALWFESYAAIMELNSWTDTEVTAGTYDEARKLWDITLTLKDGSTR